MLGIYASDVSVIEAHALNDHSFISIKFFPYRTCPTEQFLSLSVFFNHSLINNYLEPYTILLVTYAAVSSAM